MDVKLYAEIEPFVHKYLSGKISLCHLAEYPQDLQMTFPRTRRHDVNLQSPVVFCVLFLLTHQADVPQNKQTSSIAPICPSASLSMATLEESIDIDRTTLTVHIHNFENTLQHEHIYDPPNAHEHKVDPVLHYILHSGSKKKMQ